MISTVTISTVSTVTTVAMLGMTAALGVVAVVTLIAFLATKELAGASQGSTPKLVSRALNVGIVPLLMVFAVILGLKVVEVIG